MKLRIGLDLEPGLGVARTLPDLDLLDVAYGATHGGVQALLAPLAAFAAGTAYSPDLFLRPGLPLLTVRAEMRQGDDLLQLGKAPDRILVTEDRGRVLSDFGGIGGFVQGIGKFCPEVGALVEPEASSLRELGRAKMQWAFFSTETLFRAVSPREAEAEIARLSSAAVAAEKVNLRVALYGPTGRHLPATFAAIPNLEEVYPTPDLWNLAVRLGWEKAIAEYRQLL